MPKVLSSVFASNTVQFGGKTWGPWQTLGMQVGATVVVASVFHKKQQSPQVNSGLETQLSGDPLDVRRVAYGEVWTAGTLRYRNATGTDNREFYMVVVLVGHEIDSVVAVEADRDLLTLDGSGDATGAYTGLINIRFVLGTDSQAADSTLDTVFANWTTDHRLRGCAYAIIKLTFDEQLMNSIPQFRFKIRGRKVYDPRLDSTNGGSGAHRLATPSTWEWSRNAILCANDFLRGVKVNSINIAGLGLEDTRFDWANVIAEANVADENVALDAGGNQDRYTCDGMIDPRQLPDEILRHFEMAIAGEIIPSDGKWRFFCGAYRTPTLALTDQHFIGPLRHVVHKGELDRVDTANGHYAALAESGSVVSYSPVRLATATVGRERETNYDFQLVADCTDTPGTYDGGARAQRIAKLLLEKQEAGKQIVCTTNLYGLRAVPGETITVTHAAFGLSAQAMRVMEVQLRVVNNGGAVGLAVELTLEAGPSSLYAWAAEESVIGASPDLPQLVVPPAAAAGPAQWTPILVNVSRSGNVYTKTGGTNNTWDASVYSQEGHEACAASFRASQTNMDVFVGLNTDPTTDHNYTSVDYGFSAGASAVLQIYESGSLAGTFGTYTTSDQLEIRYDGVRVRYLKNGAVLRTVPRIGARLFLDSSFFQTGAAINSLSFTPISRADSWLHGNLLHTEAWAVGDVPTAGLGNFIPNETATDENAIVLAAGPHGHSQLLWEGRCTDPGTGTGGEGNGGWNNGVGQLGDIQGLDPTKTYRSTVWFKHSISSANTVHHGCGISETNNLDGSPNTNPYFIGGPTFAATGLVPDRWYLMVGIIHGSGYGTAPSGVSGIYDPETGQRVFAGTDYKMIAGATTQGHRVYMYYGGNTTVRAYWCDPRFEVVDGNEPPLSALLTAGAGLEWRREGMHDEMAYMDAAQLHRSWTQRFTQLADITLLTGLTDAPGGQAMRFGNNSGDDLWWGAFTAWLIPFDPNYLYEVGVVIRQATGGGTFYCGVEGVANDRVTLINDTGANSAGSQHYVAASGNVLTGSWATYRGYIKGTSGTPTAASQCPDARVPGTMFTGVTYIRPLIIVNYNGVAGQTDVAAIWVRRIAGGLGALDHDFYRQSTAPAHAIGRVWQDTDDSRFYRSDGSSWIQVTANDALVLANAPAEAGADVTANNADSIVFRQSAAPSSPQEGWIWIDTDDRRAYRRSSGAWVQFSADDALLLGLNAPVEGGADVTANNADNIIYRQSTAPGSPQTGWIWVDTDDLRVYRWSGAAWVQVSSNDILLLFNAGDLSALDQVDTPQIVNEAVDIVAATTDASTVASASDTTDLQYAAITSMTVQATTDRFEVTCTGVSTTTTSGSPGAPAVLINLRYRLDGGGWGLMALNLARPTTNGASAPFSIVGMLTGLTATVTVEFAVEAVAFEVGGTGTVNHTLTNISLVATQVMK